MFAGHFGLAAAVKAKERNIPLWALMLSTQLMDIAFVPLLLMNVETIETIGGGHKEILIHADYTHSLFGASAIALVAATFAWKKWGKHGGKVVFAMVFSHWLLDLVVHRADLPILPGNFGHLPLLGFGLWRWPVASFAVEFVLIGLGAIYYYRSVQSRARSTPTHNRSSSKKAVVVGTVMGILLLLSLVVDNL